MNEKFYALELKKQERIINASLKEFACNGYEKASTNEIIKRANIAKGSLFNYFNSKKELYLFLLDYAVKLIDRIYTEVNWNERDFFERMRQFGLVKFKIYKKYPQAFDFLNAAAGEGAPEVKTEIEAIRNKLVKEGLDRGSKNIDFSKFRDDVGLEKLINIINLAILGLAEQQRENVDTFEEVGPEVLKEFDEYFAIMKRCFYKREE